ncbi:MAG: hypothetical protein FWE99_00245 [Bacteroidales bacterium]|nr:hypothetical protein [Bacteroidales bacterium]
MATIILEYDYSDVRAQKTLEDKEKTVAEKRKQLDRELKNYTVDLSNFKFNREEANIYE